ncbi:MAG: PIN domain-containing protein [Bacteroidota bacterium]|nr:PIN domain-containing protein [Bacteroidota bacterium]
MKPRIYIDTSVIGGYFDKEFMVATEKLFKRIENCDFDIFFSNINEAELELAPKHVKEIVKIFPDSCLNTIKINEDIEELAQTYIREKALGKASENDAYHIALASVNRLDCLISWNFKHIVNFDKIKMFNSINIRLGYPIIDIRSPLEFLKNEE